MRAVAFATIAVRVLFGGLFVFSGLNKLVGFMPLPPMAAPGAAFIGALAATGYMLPLIGFLEAVFGALVIAGRFVPLALTVLAPLVVNIALFHVLLAPGLPVVIFLIAAEAFLAWQYRDAFAGLLQIAREPTFARDAARRAVLAEGPQARVIAGDLGQR
jgi:uncharacterized membrane protein YphA (DoxX/SURF4 family)